MTKSLRIAAYSVFLAMAVICGLGFYKNFNKATQRPVDPGPDAAQVTEQQAAKSAAVEDTRKSRMMAWGAGLVVSVICLGLIIAYDATQLLAHNVQQFVWNDDADQAPDPEYEEAEKLWANGQYLEAIQFMREYLKTHPERQHVAIRIAEVYEKDLGNPLAAALEYQEVLKKRLPSEKWSWTAIHLANLYFGPLNKPAEGEKWLRRITTEHPKTPAAKKARERLGEAEPGDATDGQDPSSNLPRGFRPK